MRSRKKVLRTIGTKGMRRTVGTDGGTHRSSISGHGRVLLNAGRCPGFGRGTNRGTPMRTGYYYKNGRSDYRGPFTALGFSHTTDRFRTLHLRARGSNGHPGTFVLAVNGLTVHRTHTRFSYGFLTYTNCRMVSGLNFPAMRTNIRTTVGTNTSVMIVYSDSSRCTRCTVPTFGTLSKQTVFVITNTPTYVRRLGTTNVRGFVRMHIGMLSALGRCGTGLKVGWKEAVGPGFGGVSVCTKFRPRGNVR